MHYLPKNENQGFALLLVVLKIKAVMEILIGTVVARAPGQKDVKS